MYDYGFSTLEQYSLTVLSTARTRGGASLPLRGGAFYPERIQGDGEEA